jgi:hypothetical protein
MEWNTSSNLEIYIVAISYEYLDHQKKDGYKN